MDIEPGWIGAAVAVILAATGGGMYVIRSEVRKGTDTATAAHEEMIPNHGSSLRDAIDRIESRMQDDRTMYLAHIGDVHADVKAIRGRLDAHIDHHERT